MRGGRSGRHRTWKQGLTAVGVSVRGRESTWRDRSGCPAGRTTTTSGLRGSTEQSSVLFEVSGLEGDGVTGSLSWTLSKVVPARGTLGSRTTTETAEMETVGTGIALLEGLQLIIGNLAAFKWSNRLTQSLNTSRGGRRHRGSRCRTSRGRGRGNISTASRASRSLARGSRGATRGLELNTRANGSEVLNSVTSHKLVILEEIGVVTN